MSEKRFSWKTEKLQHSDDEVLLVVDNENKDWKGHILNIVDLLNRQQVQIKVYEKSLIRKSKKISEQQATIRRLQDLCGESDYENAKLRIENKKLKDDLHNCRLNKNIISEKLKVWQDAHKEYDIYNIKDFKELMKKVK